MRETPLIRTLGRVDYEPTWRAMQDFTARRGPDTPDEIWLLEHPPVFTLGMAGKREHLLAQTSPAPNPPQRTGLPPEGAEKLSGLPCEFLVGIPVVPIDRGGQVTYHGPGQIVVYLLLDLKRLGYGVRELVRRIEQAVIDVLAGYGVAGARLAGAPGVYVGLLSEGMASGVESPQPPLLQRGEKSLPDDRLAKIAALGLRVKNGFTYHGLALNVDMDLAPYRAINPCGYAGMAVTQLKDFVSEVRQPEVEAALVRTLVVGIYAGSRESERPG